MLWDHVPDYVRKSAQQYCVCSVVAPKGTTQKCEHLAIRVYGCVATVEEAQKWAKMIQGANDFTDIFTIPTCQWAPLPPDVTQIEDVHYQEGLLQEIRNDYVSNLKGDKKQMADRLEQRMKQ
ncbi:unnamed protein product, partial [Chrysoparadoxa australica]